MSLRLAAFTVTTDETALRRLNLQALQPDAQKSVILEVKGAQVNRNHQGFVWLAILLRCAVHRDSYPRGVHGSADEMSRMRLIQAEQG